MVAKFSAIALACAVGFAATNASAACAEKTTSAADEEPTMQQVTAEPSELRRVIVKVSAAASEAAGGANGAEEIIERNKAKLVSLMRDNGAVLIEPIAGSPLLVMEVTPRGMQNLLGSPFVEDVQEDRPELAQ